MCKVQPIVNERLGGTITVAGLLMGADVLTQLQAAGYGDLVVLPRVMFDHPDTISLDDISPQDIANRLDAYALLWPTPWATCGMRSPANHALFFSRIRRALLSIQLRTLDKNNPSSAHLFPDTDGIVRSNGWKAAMLCGLPLDTEPVNLTAIGGKGLNLAR